MLDPGQLRVYVIEPTLAVLARAEPRLSSPAAVELLLGTALVESRLTYLRQLPDGPALGLWQMEPATHRDHRKWLTSSRSEQRILLREAVDSLLAPAGIPLDQLTWNLGYACAMARIHYWRRPDALPEADDVPGLARYWKTHFNTALGAGRPEEWSRLYRRHGRLRIA